MEGTTTKEFLVKISNTVSISGYEQEAAGIIAKEFSMYCDEVSVDKLGNVIGVKKGKGHGKIMFSGHMDEIGLMVSDIDDRGFVKFSRIGVCDQRALISQEVIIHGAEKVFGVIGLKPPHLVSSEEKKKSVPMKDMCIDTGYSADKIKELVRIGDLISVRRSVTELKNNMLTGKSFDDGAGVASLFAAMKLLEHYSHTADLYFVASIQEEMGGYGAATAAYKIQPDIGIAVDVSFAKMQGLDEFKTVEMAKGPAIGLGPNIQRRVYELLVETAKKNTIPYQLNIQPDMSYTDAMSMQITGIGVATGLVSIPLRYMHTSVEVVSMSDVEQAGRLLADFVIHINGRDLEDVLCS